MICSNIWSAAGSLQRTNMSSEVVYERSPYIKNPNTINSELVDTLSSILLVPTPLHRPK